MTGHDALFKAQFEQRKDIAQVQNAFELREILRGAILTKDFNGAELGKHIVLSTEGRRLATELRGRGDFSSETQAATLFRVFYMNDILIDSTQTDIPGLRAIIERAVKGKQLLLPSTPRRLLYDRFYELASRGALPYASTLTHEQSRRLLQDTPQGIHQSGYTIIGPSGVSVSECVRWLLPRKILSLYHCEEPSCPLVHEVSLDDDKDNAMIRCMAALHAITHVHSSSNWASGLRRTFSNFDPKDKYADIALVLFECLTLNDLRIFYSDLLRNKTISISSPKMPPEQYAQSRDRDHILEQCLSLKNRELAQRLDKTIVSEQIRLESGEVRRPFESHMWLPGDVHISSIGVRSVTDAPLAVFVSNVLSAYERDGSTSDLKWRLRHYKSDAIADALLRAISHEGLPAIATSIVMNRKPIAQHFAEFLDVTVEYLDESDSLLWRLGFDLPQLDADASTRLSNRLDEFETSVSTHSAMKQSDRDAIRRAGVNLFVDLEAILDEIICFTVWMLSSDHYSQTNFRYRHSQARMAVLQALGAVRTSSTMEVEWNPKGNNALGVLLTYMQTTSSWIAGLLERDPATELRSISPSRVTEAPGCFPFRHRAFWADMASESLQRLNSTVRQALDHLNQSQCASIRNGLDHTRSVAEFPTVDNMLKCASELRFSINTFVKAGVIPIRRKLVFYERGEFGFEKFVLRSAHDDVICITSRYTQGLPPHGSGRLLVASPSDVLGFSNLPIVFSVEFESEYARQLADYPKRRVPAVFLNSEDRIAASSDGEAPGQPEQPQTIESPAVSAPT